MFRSLKNDHNVRLNQVVDFVIEERKRMNVSDKDLGLKSRQEPSCIAFGEFNNLLYCQLIYTREGYGNWEELKGQEVLEGLLDYIAKIKNERRDSNVSNLQSEIEQGLQDTS